MKRVLCSQLPEAGKPRRLLDSEAHHLLRVLRLKDGDRVEALDGSGRSITSKLSLKSGEAWLEFDGEDAREPTPGAGNRGATVILEIAVLKGDAMEWVIEKATELGVATVVPVLSKRTIVQVERKGPGAFQQRWQKIADQSLKQCGRLARMDVLAPAGLEEVLANKLGPGETRIFLDEEARATAGSLLRQISNLPKAMAEAVALGSALHLLVGPEGGWDDEERAWIATSPGVQVASLGPLILRAETAAISAVSVVTAALRETHPSG